MDNLDENKIYDKSDRLAETSWNLEILAVDFNDGDKMQENGNWMRRLNSPKLKVLCRWQVYRDQQSEEDQEETAGASGCEEAPRSEGESSSVWCDSFIMKFIIYPIED